MRLTILCLLLIGTSACELLPTTGQATGERDPFGETGESSTSDGNTDASGSGATASTVLVQQSRGLLASGEHAQAKAAVERALRIEPNNPYLWIELGQIHLATGDYQQATALAQKAMSMAGSDSTALRAAQRLMDQATAW